MDAHFNLFLCTEGAHVYLFLVHSGSQGMQSGCTKGTRAFNTQSGCTKGTRAFNMQSGCTKRTHAFNMQSGCTKGTRVSIRRVDAHRNPHSECTGHALGINAQWMHWEYTLSGCTGNIRLVEAQGRQTLIS